MVVSPMSDYESVSEMNDAVGFSALGIAKVSGFKPYAYSTISGEIAQVLLANDRGDEMCLRAYKGTDDQSGIIGATYTDKTMTVGQQKNVKVHIGSFEGIRVAWFTVGEMAYSISVTSQTFTTSDMEMMMPYLIFEELAAVAGK